MKTSLSRLGSLSVAVRDDDLIDQLHHSVTVKIFLVLSFLHSLRLMAPIYYEDHAPLRCWIPPQYAQLDDKNDNTNYRDYIEYYCWVHGLYNIPFDEEIPVTIDERLTQDRSVLYYRWIVVIFLLQAFLFKLPNLFWKWVVCLSGFNIEKTVRMTLDIHLVSLKKRTETLITISDCIVRWLSLHRRLSSPIAAIFGKGSGCYLTRMYLLTKILYLVNIITQFKLLSSILGFDYWVYGEDVIRKIIKGRLFEDLKHFPRTALCDFEIRQLQNLHRYTVQCALPYNMFIEKVFAAEWFALTLLSTSTLISLVVYTVDHIFRKHRFIKMYAFMMKLRKGSREKKLFKKFVKNELRDDGVFIFSIISNNSSEVLAVELLEIMWTRFYKDIESRKDCMPIYERVSNDEKEDVIEDEKAERHVEEMSTSSSTRSQSEKVQALCC